MSGPLPLLSQAHLPCLLHCSMIVLLPCQPHWQNNILQILLAELSNLHRNYFLPD